MPFLFVYGTLRRPDVQRIILGREMEATADVLVGFALAQIQLPDHPAIGTDKLAVHRMLDPTGDSADQVEGLALTVTEAELAAADAYETSDYERIAVTLESGIEAFVYVRAGEKH